MKVGIDLSTTNTGITILDNENKHINSFNLTFSQFSEVNYKYNFSAIDKACKEIAKYLINIEEHQIGIELSNYCNPALTNRFNLYCGAFIDNLIKIDNVKIKTFNSSQWQQFIGVRNGETREITKLKSREFAKKWCKDYQEDWSEDLCDSFCIAFHLENVLSSEQKNYEVKQRQAKWVKEVQQRHKINKMIETRLKKLNRLDKDKNAKRIKRLQEEIDALRWKNE